MGRSVMTTDTSPGRAMQATMEERATLYRSYLADLQRRSGFCGDRALYGLSGLCDLRHRGAAKMDRVAGLDERHPVCGGDPLDVYHGRRSEWLLQRCRLGTCDYSERPATHLVPGHESRNDPQVVAHHHSVGMGVSPDRKSRLHLRCSETCLFGSIQIRCVLASLSKNWVEIIVNDIHRFREKYAPNKKIGSIDAVL